MAECADIVERLKEALTFRTEDQLTRVFPKGTDSDVLAAASERSPAELTLKDAKALHRYLGEWLEAHGVEL